ncbi:MAG: NADP-dependent malic enzyme [Candidatus Aenigmarchaeota archaeon]|nr:NADP-dependent malic enzyme [Candidatus Aenigmarchaeota archaeon]
MDFNKASLDAHREKKGKIEIAPKMHATDMESLSIAYTPGVAAVSRAIAADKSSVWDYTIKQNTIAVVTDGSAVLGLGNIGAEAALPVMEGKCMLFKEMAGVDAFPICLATQDAGEIISIVRNMAPTFGGINLEDIAAPKCFEIEEALQDIGIPVMHDDQHATSIVIQAALQNALKVAGKRIEELNVVINGAGAAGISTAKMLNCINIDASVCTSVADIVMCDSKGIIHNGRRDLNAYKQEIVKFTNKRGLSGGLTEAVKGADVFIGLSVAGALTNEMVKSMADGPIIFAMANPVPEIMPQDALDAGASIVGTGRSDFPNQINNVLAFPGVFRGALDAKATRITDEMKIAAAHALARSVKPAKDKILPHATEKGYVKDIADAVAKAATDARK